MFESHKFTVVKLKTLNLSTWTFKAIKQTKKLIHKILQKDKIVKLLEIEINQPGQSEL